MELVLLGSGGFIPTDERETACALVRNGSEALLIDAGTGVRWLFSQPDLLSGVERLHVVLTHFHLDHTIGLFYLAGFEPPVEVWGAGDVLEGESTDALVRRLLNGPFAPANAPDRLAALRELELPATRVGSFDVRARVQREHANETLALRLGDELAWCTDTAYDTANASFARGARLLFHEAFYADDSTDDRGHSASGEAARVAAAAGVDRLVLIHINPAQSEEAALLRFARPHFEASHVGRDGLVVAM